MSGTNFYRGQELGRNDLNIFLTNSSNTPVNAAEITYGLYDVTTGKEALVGIPNRIPANPSVGEYYANIVVPLDANLGNYRIRWAFRQLVGGKLQQVVQEFSVTDKAGLSTASASMITGGATNASAGDYELMGRLRILLRDNNPARNYRFSPPSHEETINQFNKVFGYIWEDAELQEYLNSALDMVAAAPPRTPYNSIGQMIQARPEWRTLLLTGAMSFALQALSIQWVHEEFGYSIGGVSLDLERSSKYASAYQSAVDRFDKQLETAKAAIKIVKGLKQPRYGIGVRSSFGPHVGRGVLTPAKYIGFVLPICLFLQQVLTHL